MRAFFIWAPIFPVIVLIRRDYMYVRVYIYSTYMYINKIYEKNLI